MDKRRKIKWLPLEANPDIIHENGIDSEWSFIDVYAVIFLFPITETYEDFKNKEETHLKIHEQSISPNLIYYKQTISNACGMMALLHSVTNNDYLITGPGVFKQIFRDTRTMSPEERAEYLENCADLAQIHESSAKEGQTKVPDIKEQLRLHFICFTKVDEHLYELDGSREFPINHGKCSNFVECAANVISQFIGLDPEEKEYSVIALTKTSSAF
ncbi:MAG: hypothetical protein EXX96DRAFT_485821 [Benjaminiella poitrasii]|nr:MAG: hypothetical protein EXX96DRAFT_485821 [Benjaminiella poitrasii]